ncbi:MAG TPA: hypothetical protein DIT09_05255 [Glutamicibacter sp.]|nr:hypothetical protein [Glutamicibacter sp.]
MFESPRIFENKCSPKDARGCILGPEWAKLRTSCDGRIGDNWNRAKARYNGRLASDQVPASSPAEFWESGNKLVSIRSISFIQRIGFIDWQAEEELTGQQVECGT